MRRLLFLVLVPCLLFLWAGCTTIKTEHHIVLDHTLTIGITDEVEDFLTAVYGDGNESDPVPAPDESPAPDKK